MKIILDISQSEFNATMLKFNEATVMVVKLEEENHTLREKTYDLIQALETSHCAKDYLQRNLESEKSDNARYRIEATKLRDTINELNRKLAEYESPIPKVSPGAMTEILMNKEKAKEYFKVRDIESNKILIIKQVRLQTGLDLRDSKQLVEATLLDHAIHPGVTSGVVVDLIVNSNRLASQTA